MLGKQRKWWANSKGDIKLTGSSGRNNSKKVESKALLYQSAQDVMSDMEF